MARIPACPSWVDSECVLPPDHDGPHYSDDDDLIWREPTPEERAAFAGMAAGDTR